MSDNVVSLFGTPKPPVERKPIDITGLLTVIVTWAQEQGIDVQHDAGFNIRVSDLMAQLQIMAQTSRETACN